MKTKFRKGDYVVEKEDPSSLCIVLSVGPSDDARKGELSLETVIGDYGAFTHPANELRHATIDEIKDIAAYQKEELKAGIADDLKRIKETKNEAITQVIERMRYEAKSKAKRK